MFDLESFLDWIAGADPALNLNGAQEQNGVADGRGQLGIMGVAEGRGIKVVDFFE